MAKIVDLPKKRDRCSDFKGKIPANVIDPLSIAYIKTKEMSEKFPYFLLKLSPGDKEALESLIKEYEDLTLTLLKRILVLEKERFDRKK